MKKLLLSVLSFSALNLAHGQIFTDDFESYTANAYLGPQSTSWSTWSGTEGATEDVKVITTNAQSGSNSIYLSSTAASGGPQDVVLKFGQLYNSGIFTFQSGFYVNAGKSAYFNMQGALTIGNVWALNVNMSGQQLIIDDGITSNLAVGSYPEATWFNLKIEANLSTHVWKAYVDGNLVGTWINGVNTLASCDFYPVQGSQFYMDDVRFDNQPYTLPSLDAMAASISSGGEIAGQTVTPKVNVQNVGQAALTSFDVALTYNGNTYNQTVTGANVATAGTYAVTMPSMTLAGGNQNALVVISNINGGTDDLSSNDTLQAVVTAVTPAPGKVVVSEEGTGTWCQWCPRGAVFMDEFHTKYDGYWIGIAVHNGDPMTVTDYDASFGNYISGYPSALVDRGTDVDPSGMSPDFFTRLQTAPVATLVNGATWDAATRKLEVSVTANFAMAANSNYKLLCVLSEDGVTGTGSSYNQSNAYSGGGNGVMGGFETKPNPVPAAQMVYDHVARAINPGWDGYPNSFPANVIAGETHTLNFSFDLPASWDETKINIIGMILSPDGRIDNAGTATITEAVGNGFVPGENAGLFSLENKNNFDCKLYPNPANDFSVLSIDLKNNADVSVEMLDFSGKVISSKIYTDLNGAQNISLNTSSLTAGIYLVKVGVNGQFETRNLVIK